MTKRKTKKMQKNAFASIFGHHHLVDMGTEDG
jgi:hypothetical protein